MTSPAFRLLSLFLGLGALLLAGCSTAPRIGGVSVQVADLRPVDATLFETRATMTVRYINENVIPLGYSGASFQLRLNGSYVGKAVSDQPIGLPPLQSITQDVTLYLENAALLRQAIASARDGVVSYRLDTVLLQTLGEEKTRVKTSAEGSIDISALAKPQ